MFNGYYFIHMTYVLLGLKRTRILISPLYVFVHISSIKGIRNHVPVIGWIDGTGFLLCFQQLWPDRDEIETRNWEKIPFSSRFVPRGHSAAEVP